MSISTEQFDALLTEEQLVKLLRDGFGSSLARTLADQLVTEFKTEADSRLKVAEGLIRDQVQKVVEGYMARTVSIQHNNLIDAPVVHVYIERKGD